MSLWTRLFGRSRVREIDAWRGQVERGATVSVTGVVEAEETFDCPLTQEICVAAAYRAHVPGFVQRAYGLHAGGAMNLVANATQAVDFFVRDPTGRARVVVDPGRELVELHVEMLQRYGFELQAQTQRLRPGDRVMVRGEVLESPRSSPMRAPDHDLLIRATHYESIGDVA